VEPPLRFSISVILSPSDFIPPAAGAGSLARAKPYHHILLFRDRYAGRRAPRGDRGPLGPPSGIRLIARRRPRTRLVPDYPPR